VHTKWVELMLNAPIDIALYWQHWAQSSQSVANLTDKVKEVTPQKLLRLY